MAETGEPAVPGDGAGPGGDEAAGAGSPPAGLAELIAGHLPAGPGLAAWLAEHDPAQVADRDLPGTAAAWRKVASWAQAAELATVAQIAVRSAARDQKAGLEADGRPRQVTRDAAAQAGLGLALSPCGAAAWAGLAVALGWRLARTGAALADGTIDLYRAKVIAEATAPLTDEAARKAEDMVLDRAGDLTYGQLHGAVRRAVIAADPEGAEQRRQAAERRARVTLYPDQDHTATLAGTTLPAVHAAAAMVRISAMARALKAAGAGGGLDYLRAHVFLGLLLGTLPLIPPPDGAPSDNDPPPDDADPDAGNPDGNGGPADLGDDNPPDQPPSDSPPDHSTEPPANSEPTEPGDGTSPEDSPLGNSADPPPPDTEPPDTEPPSSDKFTDGGPSDGKASPSDDIGPPAEDKVPPVGGVEPWPDPPPLTDADAPEDDGFRDAPPSFDDLDDGRYWGDPLEDRYASTDPVPALPPIPARSPGGDRAKPTSAVHSAESRPGPGQLDLTLPWFTLTGASGNPGTLSRIGPITAPQARHVAELAAATGHPAQWRVVLTDAHGHAFTVARVPRRFGRATETWPSGPGKSARPAGLSETPTAGPDPPHPAGSADPSPDESAVYSLVGRVTVIMPASIVARAWAEDTGGGVLPAILRAARRAHAQALEQAQADADAAGGCAHTTASAAYQPPPRVREYVTARDLTCRYPYCGQPAWRGDLDHTRPWHKGGRTCRCNLGPLCRAHHILKQLAGWTLTQPQPGVFQWTTAAGCVYTTGPDRQLS